MYLFDIFLAVKFAYIFQILLTDVYLSTYILPFPFQFNLNFKQFFPNQFVKMVVKAKNLINILIITVGNEQCCWGL